jgi:hypothetical protein
MSRISSHSCVFPIFVLSFSLAFLTVPPASFAAPYAAGAVVPGTFAGGLGEDGAVAIALHPSGDSIVIGNTEAADFPATSGSPAGGQDVWAARFDARFQSRLWTVRLGGSGFDQATSLAIGPGGEIYLAGGTDSSDFPTASAYDATANGGRDVFLARLDAATGALVFGTFLGGSLDEEARDLAVTAAGVLVVGATDSSDFPAVSPIMADGAGRDAFFSEFSAGGASLLFSSHFGGAFAEAAQAADCDSSGNPYIAIFYGDPAETGADHNRVVKLDGLTHGVVYEFPFGPQPPEVADGLILIEDLAVDAVGRATIAGTTEAQSSLPLAAAWQETYGGLGDFFLARIDGGGAALEFSTYIGGDDLESGPSLALAGDDTIALAGTTLSYNYPLVQALDVRIAGGEGVVSRFSEDGGTLLSSTYFGGSGDDRVDGLALDAQGGPLVAGATLSPELAITGLLPGGGDGDGFAALLRPTGIARFLPLRGVALTEPAQVPDPYEGADLDGDGVIEDVVPAPELPLAASRAASRGGDGRDLLSITLGTLGGLTIAGLVDVDRDGEPELLVDDPSRDRGSFEGWLLDNRDGDVDLVVRGIGGDDGLFTADLDGDGEPELVARDPLSADVAFEGLDGGESPGDGDADVVFIGGRPRAALDIDDDGEPEVVAENLSGPVATVDLLDGVGGDDGDVDVVFVGGSYRFSADLADDLIPELIFRHPSAAPGSVSTVGPVLFLGGEPRTVADLDRDGDLELIADSEELAPGLATLSPEGVLFLGGTLLGLADVDGDGEDEVLAISSALAAGTYSVSIGLESPADLDPDVIFLPAGARGVADVDGDGELEAVAQNAGLAPGTFSKAGGFEAIADGDPDVIFLGGELSLFGDLDGDFETELVARDGAAAAGSATALGGAETPADADTDVVFLAGVARLFEDLDGDGEAEVAAGDAVAAVVVHAALDAAADADAEVVIAPGVPAGVADLDGDGEYELLVADESLAPGAVEAAGEVEPVADGDADVVRVGGQPLFAGDLDGDGENELVAEEATLAAGTFSSSAALEADSEADVVFVRSAARLADLDGDGEAELLADDGAATGGSVTDGEAAVGEDLETAADGDADVIFLGGILRAVADLDGDGEREALAEAYLAAATTTLVETEASPDGDPDLVFTGGRVRQIGDLDGDGENEATAEAGVPGGTAAFEADLEGLGDGDTDLVYTAGIHQLLADYDADGEVDLATSSDEIAGGSSFHERELESPGDLDPDVAFLGTGVVDGVREPNGGETWFIGSTQAIRWVLPSPGNVRVQLSRDGGATWTNLTGSTPNDGEQLWDVKGAPTIQALVRVTSKDDGSITDTSDGTFNIPPASIELLSPNGGQTLAVGQHIEVQWSSVNLAGGIEVTVSRDGGASWEIIDATTPNDGSKGWTVTGPATANAVFRVRSAVENAVADVGDGANTISGASLAVTSPNGGESLWLGSTFNLTWSSSGLAGALHVDLSRDAGATWSRIITNTANDGVQAWTVTGAPTGQGLIRLTSVSNPSITDVSDAVFSIPAASVTVTSPNGGETVLLGSSINLQWSTSNLGGNVKVELSRDNGSSWEVIFATTPNDGTQAWRVVGAPAAQALLRVSSRNEPVVFDTSNAPFAIPPASLTLTSPNGGESWTAGSTRTITWSSSGLGGTVNLEISRDGGASWDAIFENTPNDGSQTWLVTGPSTGQALVKVRSVYAAVEDASNGTFTIP